MSIYFADWSLLTGGEFYVRADTDEEAQDIILEVINRELDRQTLDANDADVAYGSNEGEIDGPLYARDADGKVNRADHRR